MAVSEDMVDTIGLGNGSLRSVHDSLRAISRYFVLRTSHQLQTSVRRFSDVWITKTIKKHLTSISTPSSVHLGDGWITLRSLTPKRNAYVITTRSEVNGKVGERRV